MLQVNCFGSPYEIGFQHGKTAAKQIRGTVMFYKDYFKRKSNLDWETACGCAEKFMPLLEKEFSDLVQEMRGVAEGSDLPFSTVLALNVRTEISMGMMTDGCTSLAWRSDEFSVLAQNWDWEDLQQENLIILHIKRTDPNGVSKPSISQITEAGIIGKIGLNSSGVGVCLNAIRARGVNFRALPIHLALRVALESSSRAEAVENINGFGIATSGHILVADETGGTSLECSHLDLLELKMKNGKIAHTNHFLVEHASGVKGLPFFEDSQDRMNRVKMLLDTARTDPGNNGVLEQVQMILMDQDGFPVGINRQSSPGNASSTLFSIIMDISQKSATVKLGRPTDPIDIVDLHPLI